MQNAVFSYGNGRLVAEMTIDVQQIRGIGGAYCPRILFPAHFQLRSHDDKTDLAFTTLYGTFGIEGTTEKLGELLPAPIQRLTCSYQDIPASLQLEAVLDLPRIEVLEQNRKTDMCLWLKLELCLLAFGPAQIWQNPQPNEPPRLSGASTLSANYSLTIPQSTWIKQVLPGLGYGTIKLIELPAVSSSAIDGLKDSFSALSQAEEYFKMGFYDDAAGKCRIALEPFFERVRVEGISKRQLRKEWETIAGAATYEWLGKILGSINDSTNKPHHVPNACFSRFDAQMLLTVTGSIISYAARIKSSNETQHTPVPSP